MMRGVEQQDEEEDQDQDYDASEGGDDYDEKNGAKGESLSTNMVGTATPSYQYNILLFTLFPENILDNFKIKREEGKGTNVTNVSDNTGKI